MIKRIAIGVLLCSVIAVLIFTTMKIITQGSNRSEEQSEVINLSDILKNATIVGTYTSNIEIRSGESISALELLNTAISNPVSNDSDSIIVDLEHCSVFFESGQTSETVDKSGKSTFTVVASSKRIEQNYIYFVEVNALEALVTQITTTGKTPYGSNSMTVTTTDSYYDYNYYYEYNPKNTAAVTTVKKGYGADYGYISGIYGTGTAAPGITGAYTGGNYSPSVTVAPSVPETPETPSTQPVYSEEAPPATIAPAPAEPDPVPEPEPDPVPEPQPDPEPAPEPDPVPDPEPQPDPAPEPSPEQPQ